MKKLLFLLIGLRKTPILPDKAALRRCPKLRRQCGIR